jgi:arginine decarboxylase-like protein
VILVLLELMVQMELMVQLEAGIKAEIMLLDTDGANGSDGLLELNGYKETGDTGLGWI